MSIVLGYDDDSEFNKTIEQLEKEIEEVKEMEKSTLNMPPNQQRSSRLKELSDIISRKRATINEKKGIWPEDPIDFMKRPENRGGYRKISRKITKSVRRSSKGTHRSSKGRIARKSAKREHKSSKKRKSLRRR